MLFVKLVWIETCLQKAEAIYLAIKLSSCWREEAIALSTYEAERRVVKRAWSRVASLYLSACCILLFSLDMHWITSLPCSAIWCETSLLESQFLLVLPNRFCLTFLWYAYMSSRALCPSWPKTRSCIIGHVLFLHEVNNWRQGSLTAQSCLLGTLLSDLCLHTMPRKVLLITMVCRISP